MSVNNVKISGFAYKSAVRYTNSGKAITSFGLNFWNGKDKNGANKYSFVNCTFFGETNIADRQEVEVEGYLCANDWTDKYGQTRRDLSIIAKSITNVMDQKTMDEKFLLKAEIIDDTIPF